MPPLARPFPRFLADTPRESRPYGRWEERLSEAFVEACSELAEDAGTAVDPEALRFFPDRTWGGTTYVPVVGRGIEQVDGVLPEFFGHITFRVEDGDGYDEGDTGADDVELVVTADFTDVTADQNAEWQVDLNDDVIGQWRADGDRGGEVTLIWGTPLLRGALAATAELDGEVLDQVAVNDGRFTLIAVDAIRGFSDDLFLTVKLWDRRLNEIAAESLYEDDDGEDEEDDPARSNGAAP